MKSLLILVLLLLSGCSSTHKQSIIEHRDSLLLIDCATPTQPKKFAELILKRCKEMNYDIPHYLKGRKK